MNMPNKYYKTNTSHYAKCRTLLLRFQNMHRVRFFLTCVILFANCYFHVITLPILRYGDLDRGSALLWGMFAFMINLVVFVTAFFASADRLNLVYLLLVLLLVSSVIGFLHPYAGIALGILFLTQIPECFKMKWVKRQQGYPYFNERYQLQQDYKRMTSEFIGNEKEETPRLKPRRQKIVVFSMPDDEKSYRK